MPAFGCVCVCAGACLCRWLSTEQDDGSISRVLLAGSSRPPVTYRVTAATSDVRGAGTDANVYLQLHGLLGDGLQQPLLGGPSAFERWVGQPGLVSGFSERQVQCTAKQKGGVCEMHFDVMLLYIYALPLHKRAAVGV